MTGKKNYNIHGLWLLCKLVSITEKKVKNIFVPFISHNSDFYIGIESLHLAIQT